MVLARLKNIVNKRKPAFLTPACLVRDIALRDWSSRWAGPAGSGPGRVAGGEKHDRLEVASGAFGGLAHVFFGDKSGPHSDKIRAVGKSDLNRRVFRDSFQSVLGFEMQLRDTIERCAEGRMSALKRQCVAYLCVADAWHRPGRLRRSGVADSIRCPYW